MGTVKYTGPVASFHCPTNAEIRSLKVHFSPKQEGSGDPSPENVREIAGWDGVEQYYSRKNVGHIVGYSAITLTNPYNNKIVTNPYGTTLNTVEPERSIIITQSQAPDTSIISSYKNGYMVIELDNLVFGVSYDISFKVTNITSNPLNATLQNLGLGVPNGTRRDPTEIRDNILIYKNFPFNQRDIQPNQMDFYLRICGMSFTLSDFMVTPAGMNDGLYEPYTDKRIVKWNQWLPPLTAENWQAYNTSNNDVQFENGIATSTWLNNTSGYSASVRTKAEIVQKNKEIWYVSYMLKTSMSGGHWGIEYNGGLQNTLVLSLDSDTWTRCSDCSIYWKGNRNYVYISYYRGGINEHTGMVAQVKSPLFINLTQMFGAGNEPTKEEFEEQCILNGIDLTSALPYDEGSIREWKTNGALLRNNIIFPVLGKNKFNINVPYAEPSDTSSSTSTVRIFQPYTYCLGLSASNGYLPDRITDSSISNNTLTFSAINTSYGVGFAIPLQPGSYRMTYTGENVTRALICYNNEGDVVSTSIDSQGIFYISPNTSIAVIIFRSSTVNTPTTVSNIQIEEGTTATEYEEFNPNHTVYGGWVDLITGEVAEKYTKYTLNGTETGWSLDGSGDIRRRVYIDTLNLNNVAKQKGIVYSNYCKTTSSTNNWYVWISTGGTLTSCHILFYVPATIDTIDKWVDYLSENPLSICYELATPRTYSLTPTTLQTFLGQNNVWSNADYVEVEYDLHETQDILARKQFIIANQPHLEELSGSIATFNTDMSAPLKKCKVYFSLVQEGSGDPSPDNVRAISGWTGITLNQSDVDTSNPTSLLINWTTEVGTVYGGYMDLVGGELVAEYEILSDTWGNWGTVTDQGDGTELRYKKFTNPVYGDRQGNNISYCNVAKYHYTNNNGKVHFYISSTSYNCRIYLPSGTDTNLQIQAVGKLVTPIHYLLTPTQLKTLRGTNNIWASNNGGNIEVSFWRH